MSSEALAEEDR